MKLYCKYDIYFYDYDLHDYSYLCNVISEFIEIIYFEDTNRLILKTSTGIVSAENVDLELYKEILLEFNFFSMYLDLTKFNLIFCQ